MKYLIYLLPALFLLTGCPKEEEIKNMENGIAERKAGAIEVIKGRNYSLEGLLKAQEYFFDFSEKVHMMIVEKETVENVQKLISKKGIKNFCAAFVMPLPIWQELENYCANGQFYKCSPEIKEYSNTINKFKELAGETAARAFEAEATCNN